MFPPKWLHQLLEILTTKWSNHLPSPHTMYCADWTQSIYGSILAMEDLEFGWWPPPLILQYYAWWCEKVDPLVGHNPMWYVNSGLPNFCCNLTLAS